jgi:uncharacterized membrane protein
MNNAPQLDWVVLTIQALMGMAGGLIRELKTPTDKPKTVQDYLTEMMVGSFTGAVTGLLLGDYVGGTLLYGFCAIGGYLGILLLDPVANRLRSVVIKKVSP